MTAAKLIEILQSYPPACPCYASKITRNIMKIYRVKVVFETVVRAGSALDACSAAIYAVKNEDEPPTETTPINILTAATLPPGWNLDCRPWGERDPMDRTLGEIFGHNDQVELPPNGSSESTSDVIGG